MNKKQNFAIAWKNNTNYYKVINKSNLTSQLLTLDEVKTFIESKYNTVTLEEFMNWVESNDPIYDLF